MMGTYWLLWKPKVSIQHFSRDLLWRLRPLFDDAWVCSGDFNEVLSLSEKIGGNTLSIAATIDFQVTLSNCELMLVFLDF